MTGGKIFQVFLGFFIAMCLCGGLFTKTSFSAAEEEKPGIFSAAAKGHGDPAITKHELVKKWDGALDGYGGPDFASSLSAFETDDLNNRKALRQETLFADDANPSMKKFDEVKNLDGALDGYGRYVAEISEAEASVLENRRNAVRKTAGGDIINIRIKK